jgi:CHAD domain-containing protein
MSETSAITLQFLEEYERLKQRLNKSLREYLGDPGTVHTQSLRAAIRRLDTAILVLPKRTREQKSMRRCHERCKKVLRETSRVRDIDILREKISKHPEDPTVALMLNNFREEREEFVDRSKKAAWKLFEHHAPRLEKRELPGFVRRVETVLDELNTEIGTELHIAVRDEAKVEELHSLRKHCKRLGYTLELFPSVEHYSRLIADLRKWQDVLGEIRDSDVIVDYLSRARPTDAVKAALASERAFRHRRYVSFVDSCGRGSIGRPLRLVGARVTKVPGSRSGP